MQVKLWQLTLRLNLNDLAQTLEVVISNLPQVLVYKEYNLISNYSMAILKFKDCEEGIEFSQKEALILQYLFKTPQGIVKDDLTSSIWGKEALQSQNLLEIHISNIRKKFKEAKVQLDVIVENNICSLK